MEPIALGDLITALESLPGDHSVTYDFGGCQPDGVNSYRGYYEDLAVGWKTPDRQSVAVAALLAELRGAVGSQFSGYKGGVYVMTPATRVWVANYRHCTGTAVTGVIDTGYSAVISTAYCM